MLRVATERLYYHDSYLTEFEGQVVDLADHGRRVYLDRTAFYPASGGQPYDVGELGGQAVLAVADEEDGRIAHMVAAPLAEVAVTGRIDWPRRYDHMQQHTGQHLLSAVMVELYGFQTVSFHMGDALSTIELAAKEVNEKQLAAAEDQANDWGRAGRPVRVGFADAEQVAGLRKQSQRSGTLRIVEIEGIDKSACGGTHIRSLAETLPVQIRKVEKVRGNVRLEFVCGGRALRRARQDFKLLQEIGRQTGAAMDTLPEHVVGLKERLSEAEKSRQTLTEELAQHEGREAYLACVPSMDGLRRAQWHVERIGETERAKAIAFVTGSRSMVLVTGKHPAGVLIASSGDSEINAGAILKQTLADFGGRGGGSATLAQGSLPDQACLHALTGKLGLR